jgi:SHS family lactate transporter-like MFS transporter
MLTAVTLAVLLIPLWILAPNVPTIMVGAFLMQFMVQGAWGVIPAHITELSPHELRGFFPGFAYQVGVLCASSIGYIESSVGEHLTYSTSMGIAMAVVIACLWMIIKLGPEEHGKVFILPKSDSGAPLATEQLRPTGSL